MSLAIWGTALLGYALFWWWYVGFRPRVTGREVDELSSLLESSGNASEVQRHHILDFLRRDDGKDFVMVNLLHLAEPLAESREKLGRYQKIFLGSLSRRAGHPVMFAQAASGKLKKAGVSLPGSLLIPGFSACLCSSRPPSSSSSF